ncbi:hypothetical protein [Halobaculum sp. D14]|uniref:hypothetical protein n=1 Tax=unclassified Halobaculum TaxID=2640896 RepID=UPI003EC03257
MNPDGRRSRRGRLWAAVYAALVGTADDAAPHGDGDDTSLDSDDASPDSNDAGPDSSSHR